MRFIWILVGKVEKMCPFERYLSWYKNYIESRTITYTHKHIYIYIYIYIYIVCFFIFDIAYDVPSEITVKSQFIYNYSTLKEREINRRYFWSKLLKTIQNTKVFRSWFFSGSNFGTSFKYGMKSDTREQKTLEILLVYRNILYTNSLKFLLSHCSSVDMLCLHTHHILWRAQSQPVHRTTTYWEWRYQMHLHNLTSSWEAYNDRNM